MATAVQPKNSPTLPVPSAGPLLTGALGAVVMLVGIAVAAYGVPMLWARVFEPSGEATGGLLSSFVRIALQVATLVGFARLASLGMGSNPPKGTRGAIGLIVSLVLAVICLVNAVGKNMIESAYGSVVTAVVLGTLIAASVRLLQSKTGRNFMVQTEEQGWYSLFSYKPAQGLKARRYTLIGLLVVGWTGIYSLMNHTLLNGDWVWNVPFADTAITLLADMGNTLPILLAGAVFWLAWRAVNVPTFADFLIATEVEMNKVSWSSRKRLVQDTIVVLSFVILMTLFLMVVDFFWGWLLSREWVGVLPSKTVSTAAQVADSAKSAASKW